MSKLFVIGNGFDLWHGLPTNYALFYEFAKETLDDFEQFCDVPQVGAWYDFENSLGRFDWSLLYDAHNYTDSLSDNFKPSEAYGLEDDLKEQADGYVDSIKELFQEWIEGIDVSVAEVKFAFPIDSSFINFNYTSTLQLVYGVKENRIFHIHGRADNLDELIFGHGETRVEIPELDENGDSNRTIFSDAESAAKYPFYALQKPVDDVLKKHQDVFSHAKNVNEIVIIGHSLNNVDLPYFKKLAEYAPNAQWLVYCYNPDDKIHLVEQLLKCGVHPNRIKTRTY
jgi:Bacteriophage abortive infection AbiH